jgi:hypothetical protein
MHSIADKGFVAIATEATESFMTHGEDTRNETELPLLFEKKEAS